MAKATAKRDTPSGETSGLQLPGMATVTSLFGRSQLVNPLPAKYSTYRQMRRHPTIAMARAISMAPVLSASWSVEADDGADHAWVQFIDDQYIRRREAFMESALRGMIDFGWQGFEQVYEVDDWSAKGRDESAVSRVVLRKLKPLIQDLTQILIDGHGNLTGYQQGHEVIVLDKVLHIAREVEGTQWHGESLLENARKAWNDWNEAAEGAGRYDRKVAGSHWVIYYPVGQTQQADGSLRDNSLIAAEILRAMESSGSVTIPQAMQDMVDDLNRSVGRPAWDVQIISDGGGKQPTFIDRMEYLDKLLVRGLLIPERAMMEASAGTRADAGAHIDLMMEIHEQTHERITEWVNEQSVDRLMAWNFGPQSAGMVRLVANPITDQRTAFYREVYRLVLANPAGFIEEIDRMDMDSLREAVGIGVRADAGERGEMPSPGQDDVDENMDVAMITELYEQIQRERAATMNGGNGQ